jgi:hypothetical protein
VIPRPAGRAARGADAGDPLRPFLDRLVGLSIDDLSALALPQPDLSAHDDLVDRVYDIAEDGARIDDVERAAEAAKDYIVVAFARRGFDPTWFGLNWGRSLSRSNDRAVLMLAVVDAAVAAAAGDLLTEGDAAALSEPFELAASMTGTATSANPSAGRISPIVVRIAWVVGAFGWVVLSAQMVFELVEDIVRQIYDNYFF